ncbi:MAG TPA: cbb3-type cytochrome c oxidase subunit 3 [Bacteroidetes bacterium]|nr:cbb3-type cytochrome c oxidase subunit 3 [Bacteroidota bacterium]
MFSQILSHIAEIELFPIIGLVIFFTFFIGVIIWTVRLDNNVVDHMKELPLEPDSPEDSL